METQPWLCAVSLEASCVSVHHLPICWAKDTRTSKIRRETMGSKLGFPEEWFCLGAHQMIRGRHQSSIQAVLDFEFLNLRISLIAARTKGTAIGPSSGT